jgi:CheY-specific phosphatase CheX
MRTKTKSILIISALIIMVVGTYGGMKEWIGASSVIADTKSDLANTNISDLMTSMNIFQLNDPEQSPDFSLMSLNGDQINLSEFEGKVVLMSFWATW